MTPERWQQVRELLLTALEREPERRAAFLTQVCAGDSSLRAEVESLIASYEEDENFMEAPALDARLLTDSHLPTIVGRFIGPYQVIREIGHGGMGTVYLAMRADDQYRKQVAIKLVRRGMDTEDILSRFRHERQILASLDHPNIARLIDGGTTEDGLPYFVMEYIEGQAIDQYCDTHKLSTVERLQLFRTVCAAVQYAHQNLVVHRDIKPGNIIVTTEGVPKLLDFGIAKLLNPELYAQTFAPTVTAMRPMTPDYASPEQVRGQAITTTSDIYSLGVLLYELLTGHRPYRVKTSLPQEIERVICEQDPEKPSTVINRTEDVPSSDGSAHITLTPELVSRTREGQPEKLRRRLSGDLDNIVLKAMRKEPQRRYASVGQFSEDIRRHLEGLPVIARQDTFSYRTGKFIKRHKIGVAVATAFVILIISFGVIAAMQSARTARERDRAARERDKAKQVSAFLVDIFDVNFDEYKGDTVTAREVLDKGAERVAQELQGQPEVQATLMEAIGNAYSRLGLFDHATPLLEKALAIRRQIFGNENLDVATNIDSLAENLQFRGHYAAAESLFRECLMIRRKLLGDEHLGVAESMNDLAVVLKLQGNFTAAEPLYRETLALRRRLLGNENLAVAWSLNNLASLLRDKGEYEAAEPLYREALAIFRKFAGEEDASVTTCLNNLGTLLRLKGDYEAAESLFQQSLTILRRKPIKDHPDIAVSLNNLALVLYDKGDSARAETLLREALALRRKALGEEHPLVATSLNNLALVLHDKGDYAAAEALYRQALQLRRKLLPQSHTEIALSLVSLGRLLTDQDHPQQAEPLLREGVKIQHKALPQGHWQIADAESVLGGCLAALKRYDEAEPLLVESYSVLKAKRGEGNRQTQQALACLINLYKAWGKPDKAAQYHAGNGSRAVCP